MAVVVAASAASGDGVTEESGEGVTEELLAAAGVRGLAPAGMELARAEVGAIGLAVRAAAESGTLPTSGAIHPSTAAG